VEAARVEGSGEITARGGDGGDSPRDDGSGGGGGRVAIHADAVDDGRLVIGVRGGRSPRGHRDYHGGAGTIVLVLPDSPNGRLRVDGEDLAGQPTRLVDVGRGRAAEVQPDRVRLWDVGFSTPGGQPLLAGRSVRFGDAADDLVLPIESHDTTTLVFVTGGLDLSARYAPEQPLRGIHVYDAVVVTGGATLYTRDVLRVLGALDDEGGTLDAPTLERPE